MVPSQDVHLVRVLDFEGEQQADGLDALASPVYVISHEQVGGLRRKAPVLEES